jgi:hypothetical protein
MKITWNWNFALAQSETVKKLVILINAALPVAGQQFLRLRNSQPASR